MKFLNNINMRKKLIFSYLAIVIIPIIVIGYFLTNKLNYVTFENTTQLSKATSKQLVDNFTNKLLSGKDIIDTLVNDVQLRQYINTYYSSDYDSLDDYIMRIRPMIDRLTNKNNDVLIRVYTNNDTIGFSGETNNAIKDLEKWSWFSMPKAIQNSLCWTSTDNIAGGGKGKYIGCYRTLRSDSDLNKINAIIAVFLNESKLYSLIKEESRGGKVIFLCDENNKIITSTERGKIFSSMNKVVINNNIDVKSIEDNSIVNYNAKNYNFFKVEMNNPELLIKHWSVIYMVPADKTLNGINNIWISSYILCFICFVFSLVILLCVSNNITSRLSDLLKNITNVQRGDFQIKSYETGNDEIAVISNNFNSMVGKIDTLINEVFQANIKVRNAEINFQKIEVEKKEAEIIALQGQINPHYLFNTLEVIRMNLILKGDRETAYIIKVFSESFRVCIDCEQEMYTLRDELQFIENYFVIQRYRFGEKLCFCMDIPETLLNCSIPKLIIQPMIENAVYHGLELKAGYGTIELKVFETEGIMHIRVSDNGVGIEEEELKVIRSAIYEAPWEQKRRSGGSIALRNVHNRLKLMYGNGYGLCISSCIKQGTVVEIMLPIIR